MKYKTELSRRAFKAGYVVVKGIVDGAEFGGDDYESSHAETPSGHYIGSPQAAFRLCNLQGIVPELARPGDTVCSTGFSEAERKWYGWSHRAICGFGIGDTVVKGDCAYMPANMDDAKEEAIRFWSDERHLNVTAVADTDEDGRACFAVAWVISTDPALVPNKKRRGQISGCRHYPPEKFGNGEWTAKTLADARQMAVDFAESVS